MLPWICAAIRPAFGDHVAVELSGENGRMLWIPEGFGHAFLVLSEVAGFAYKVTDYYNPKGERTIVWNDPELAIAWPVVPEEAIVSRKTRRGRRSTLQRYSREHLAARSHYRC